MHRPYPSRHTTLPPELLLIIAKNLQYDDLVMLRSTSHYIQNLIPAPTIDDLLAAEQEDWAMAGALFACASCMRLRREWKFDFNMVTPQQYGWQVFHPDMHKGQPNARNRFCHDCGARDLPGDLRYQLGDHWINEEHRQPVVKCERCHGWSQKSVDYVRCRDCGAVGKPPHCIHSGQCLACFEKECGPFVERRLTDLSPEILLNIIGNLNFSERIGLSRVSRFLYDLIPKPSQEELLIVETEPWAVSKGLLVCGGCVALRPEHMFLDSVRGCFPLRLRWKRPYDDMQRGNVRAKERFCNDCGVRALPGPFRHQRGAQWSHHMDCFVRCKGCERIAELPDDTEAKVIDGFCAPCSRKPLPFPPRSLATLPPELLLAIAAYLQLDDLMSLRRVSCFPADVISPPTHEQILIAEKEQWAEDMLLLACGGCIRLRPKDHFDQGMIAEPMSSTWMYSGMDRGGPKARQRFCNECGVRDLPGEFRYQLPQHWSFRGTDFVRCEGCGDIGELPKDSCGDLLSEKCVSCYEKDQAELRWGRRLLEEMYRTGQARRPLIPLDSLPEELLLAITDHLALDDLMVLRHVSRFFRDFIPRPTHDQLLAAEAEPWARDKYLACGGCVCLRSARTFGLAMLNPGGDMEPGGLSARRRFCLECGVRDLPGKFRYEMGDHWHDDEQPWIRCESCEMIAEPPEGLWVGVCATCFDAEIAKTWEETEWLDW